LSGLLFIIPALLVAYWVLARFSGFSGLQRGLALAVLVVFTELVSARLWWPGPKVLIRELVLGLLIAYLLGIFGHIRESRRSGRGTGLRGWGTFYVTALFALILSLNLGLLYISEVGVPSGVREKILPAPASSLTFPGLVAANAQPQQEILRHYLRGLRRLGEKGWSLNESWSSGPTLGVATTLRIAIQRQDQTPLSGVDLHVNLLSSVSADRDRWLLLEEEQPGVYQVSLTFANAGIWGLALRLDYAQETLHLLSIVDVSTFPRAPTKHTPPEQGEGN